MAIFVVETCEELADSAGLALGGRLIDLVRRLAVITTSIGFDDTGIDREPFTFDQATIHARSHHGIEQLSKDVAVTEAAVANDREGRVVGHSSHALALAQIERNQAALGFQQQHSFAEVRR